MAAIVRSAARRLAGSALLQRGPAAGALNQPKTAAGAMLQRTQASGPIPARFTSSTKQPVDEIQMKKEELYDLISLTENSIHTDTRNRRLLRSLSAQIEPRPHDSKWRFMLGAKRRSDVIRPVGIVGGLALGFASVLLLCSLEEDSQAILKEQKEQKAAMKKAAKEKKKAAKEKELALA